MIAIRRRAGRRQVLGGLVVLLVALAALGGAGAGRAGAHTCADYPNQAAAQRAADTLDADHDGIYCEALPCPCLKPGPGPGGGGSAPMAPAGAPRSPPSAGPPSVTLGPLTRRSGCRIRGPLPDPGCTPGARFPSVGPAVLCRAGYAGAVRDVSAATKDAVYRAYGIRRHFDGANGEVDHLVSLELGGSNVVANLFPEAASPRPGSHEKDRLENKLSALVCRGLVPLAVAQRMIAKDWIAAMRWVDERFPGGVGRRSRSVADASANAGD